MLAKALEAIASIFTDIPGSRAKTSYVFF